MSKIRGSYYVDGRRSLTLTTSDDDKLMDVGFRLVHDAASRVLRGGSWLRTADYARAASRGWRYPVYRSDDLGIRLCVDWRKE